MLKRYQICVDEEVRAAMEKTDIYVTTAKAKAEAEQQKVVAMR